MKKFYLLAVLITALTQTPFSQVAINTDGSYPASSAMLDVKSSSKGILFPRLTTGQRSGISSPATGLLVYDSDENHFFYFDGTSWLQLFDGDVAIDNLSDASSDQKSIFLGFSAGVSDDGTNYNTCIGYKAAFMNTSGTYNNSIGFKSLYSNSSGDNNLAVGAFSLYSNTTGKKNVAIGNNANYFNQEGSQNTIIGNEAGKGTSLHNKSGDVFIGYQAGFNETGSNKLYIENSNSASPLIYGEFDNDLQRINGTLDINNAYQFPSVDGTASQLMRTNGSGTLSWLASNGSGINDLSDGKANATSVFLGANSGSAITTGTSNTATGIEALHSNTGGSYNSALGYESAYTNTSGDFNTAVGYFALKMNDSGDSNTAVGYLSLKSCTSYSNTAVRYASLENNTSGFENTAFGYNAIHFPTGNAGNTAMGYSALQNCNNADYNTAFGYNTIGSLVLNGSYNTAIGQNAHPYSETMEYTATFGYNAVATASGKIKFGDNLNVTWIGGHSAWHNTSDERFKHNIKEDVPGLAFILKLRPVTYQLDVFALDRFCGIPDSVLHTNDLKSRELTENNRNRIRTGFIAQEVEKTAKECGYDFDGVYHPQNKQDVVYSLAYSEFVVPLVKSVQEQQQEIDALKESVEKDKLALERLVKKSHNNKAPQEENK